MNAGVFITGTDTDIGKTIVTAGLLRVLRKQGVNACSMKPIQTGALPGPGGLDAIDLTFHHKAAEMKVARKEYDVMAPCCYEPECSPHLAGRMAGEYPDMEKIVSCYRQLVERYDLALVEGAGGVYCPIDESQTMLDLMARLKLPVVLTARRGLGTINHSLLSINAIRNRGLELLGVVFNESEDIERDYIRKDNVGAVEKFGDVAILGDIDYLATLESDPDAAWATFECSAGELLNRLREVRV
ncbi:MAG: dethiobiotin synthase [Candidatus Hydrogenedentes bacterium]|jgi:dethiobiotin synthase|nr:dethiobiotin synthase [Candidatus Hydrogenedentota bacterium]